MFAFYILKNQIFNDILSKYLKNFLREFLYVIYWRYYWLAILLTDDIIYWRYYLLAILLTGDILLGDILLAIFCWRYYFRESEFTVWNFQLSLVQCKQSYRAETVHPSIVFFVPVSTRSIFNETSLVLFRRHYIFVLPRHYLLRLLKVCLENFNLESMNMIRGFLTTRQCYFLINL